MISAINGGHLEEGPLPFPPSPFSAAPSLFAQVHPPPQAPLRFTRGLSRSPGLTSSICTARPLPSTQDVYLNFKWRGLLQALEAAGFSRPLDYPLSRALCRSLRLTVPRTMIGAGVASRGPRRRGGESPVFFAFQSPGSCFLQIEIARKNLPAGITEGF